MRYVLAIALMLFSFSGLVLAQSTTDDTPWQAVVTQQVEAFRYGDSAAALAVAGLKFKESFANPDDFYAAIERSGYAPIIKSRSHSFGDFQKISDALVVQVVKFVGPDYGLYEALYQMGKESDGWRVLGVALKREQGIGA
ncbi:DUF4864 domain-containing protein [Devosia rhodophyticola]|uniref:DUF4864 domain-containing protein n=1 Tax=Devosia rhodophyticola TaxID=3026423 RepID=A0ABY7YVD2_9HYPH|nr:DUF4864 domain-containing protein [Devosia rhodophyticola]WDR05142.1 DUF4864 domain-containing protein [Devosia rhodophyticola]